MIPEYDDSLRRWRSSVVFFFFKSRQDMSSGIGDAPFHNQSKQFLILTAYITSMARNSNTKRITI